MDAMILERTNHLETGTIAHVRKSRIAVTSEVALQNASVGGAVEQCTPRLELVHASGRFLRMNLRHAPTVDVLSAAHRVGEVNAPVVPIVHVAHGGGNTTLGHYSVRLAQQRLAHHAH